MNRNEIAAWYDGFLPYMERDAQGVNPRREHIKAVLRQILRPGMRVLEPGCGIGLNSIFMARELGCAVTAVDIAPKLIEAAQRMHPHENIWYVCGDFADPEPREEDEEPVYGGDYDAIILADVLEHIPEGELGFFVSTVCQYGQERDGTVIYANLPGEDYQRFIQASRPEAQQVVDEAVSPGKVLRLFRAWDFRPVHMSIYGIDAPCQYQEYVFLRTGAIQEQIRKALQ